jgi:O-acetyl-ADP-ribose deacetylase (regulator of RNase III)
MKLRIIEMDLYTIVFVDIHPKWIKTFKKVYNEITKDYKFKFDIQCVESNIKTVRSNYFKDEKLVGYVSPANSYGYMDGGIDKVYSQMFPNIEKNVRNAIQSLQYYNYNSVNGNDKILPVGNAIKVKANDSSILIAAPTMLYPMDVSDTQNAYKATLATLKCIREKKVKISVLFLPGMATGVGKMDLTEAITQMLNAIKDFEESL